ncbi:MAG TPA: site-specific DNA-methyltransferase [Nitrososphaera sp.]|nr:site-specific DNA-methyltransferase [Nitrososphaera sp.]
MSVTTKKVNGVEYLYFSYYDQHEKKKKEIYCGRSNEAEAIQKATELKRDYLVNQYKEIEKELRLLDEKETPPKRKQASVKSPSITNSASALELFKREAVIHEPEIYFKSSEDMSEVEDNSVQLVVTSPPYNVGKDYTAYRDDKDFEEYLDFLDRVWRECKRVLCKGGRIAINVADTWRQPYVPLHALITVRMLKLDFKMRGIIYWNKGASVGISTAWGSWRSPSNPTIRDVGEYILIFSKDSFKLESTNKIPTITSTEFTEYTKSLWTFPTTNGTKDGHPAPFPEELPRRLIKFYTYLGDTVLDPFLGSGTTCKVAKSLGRKSIGYEIDKSYKAEIQKKIAQAETLAIPLDSFMISNNTLEALLEQAATSER